MQTRNALRKLGGKNRDWGEGGLSAIADQLVSNFDAREAARMDDAQFRADTMGAGPHLAALRRLVHEVTASALHDNTAPAIMRADMHALLKDASTASPADSGLRRAAVHAYRLFGKDPQGVLTVGDVARLRDHYAREYPRSKIATVIDRDFPKTGFNTLPVARLTRIATDIARHSDAEGADPQMVYEAVMQREALNGNKPEQLRARAYIRGLLEGYTADADVDASDPAARTVARMASHADPLLNKVGQMDFDTSMDDAGAEADEFEPEHDEAAEEIALVPSPITGEDLVLELAIDEGADNDDGLGTNEVDVLPDGLDGLSMMGQLEDMRGDVGMGPEANETVTVIPDPSDPDGAELEVTLRPIEVEHETIGEPESEVEITEDGDGRLAFSVYAYSAGKREKMPIDTFRAAGMASALRRVADHGVVGRVMSTPEALHREALIVLDDARGEYLSIVAENAGVTAIEAPPDGINEQQPDAIDVPDDGGQALKQAKSPAEVKAVCARLGLTPTIIETRVLDGETVKAAGWSVRTSDDNDVELRNGTGPARVASLMHLDDVIATFMTHVAHAAPAAKTAHYDVTELFSVHCAACKTVSEYPMPKTAEDAQCPCGHVTSAQRIASTFANSNPVTGYIVVSDVPNAKNDRERALTARRILAAVQKVVPAASGTLRKDAKLELAISADERALSRVKRVLEQHYGVTAFNVTAQALDSSGMPAQNATGVPGATQPSAEGPAFVGPPPAAPAVAAPVQQAPAVAPTMPQAAAFSVEYQDSKGNIGTAPVDARSAASARAVFARFNPEMQVIKVTAQLDGPPPMPAELPPPLAPGAPEGGSEDAPMPVEDQLVDPMPEQVEMFSAGNLSPEELEAVAAVALSLRQEGIGPLDGASKLHNKVQPLLEQYGDKSDMSRHLMEAEIMKALASAWLKPVVLQAPNPARRADLATPSVNTQQPDAVSGVGDLGADSEVDDSLTNVVEAPKVNTQVDPLKQPGAAGADTKMQPDSEGSDPGDFGAGKPKAQHPASDQKGVSLPSTDMGKDSDTGDTKTTRQWDSASGNNDRSAQRYKDDPYFSEDLWDADDEGRGDVKPPLSPHAPPPAHPRAEETLEPGMSVRRTPSVGDDFLDDSEPDHDLTARQK